MTSNFRVIVVGGGPVGLIAAHMFAKAGIDFVVLERRADVTADEGASLALWPTTFRLLDQLNLLDSFLPAGNVLHSRRMYTLNGSFFKESDAFGMTEEHHGYSLQMFHRADIMKGLYNNMSDDIKARVLLNKRVTDIQITADAARVTCDDGTVEEGSMVVGADGVNSNVRNLLRNLALAAPPALAPKEIDAERPFPSTYRLMFGNAPRQPHLEAGICYEAHGSKVSTQLFVGRDRMWFFVYEQLDKLTLDSVRYTPADEAAFVQRLAHIHMAEDLTFGDLYATRRAAGISNLGEGVAKTWGWNRIVLAGDAAHKVTPNIGWGFNSGAADMAVLANSLCHLLATRQHPEAIIATTELDRVFAEYQAERKAFVDKISDISARVTRMHTWNGGVMRFLDRCLWPALNMDRFVATHFMGPLVATTPVLDFAAEHRPHTGHIPWVHLGASPAITVA